MSVINIERLCRPASVAVIGASARADSVGYIVLRNLVQGGFTGPVWAVNPSYAVIDDMPCFRDIAALPAAPDLAVICTPPDTLPGIIDALGARGTRAAIAITAPVVRVDPTPAFAPAPAPISPTRRPH